ncbi:MAG TPA: hypothetical protein VI193_08815 [Acidimicrobiia bacterium]
MATLRWLGKSESLLFSLVTVLLVACATPPTSAATTTTGGKQAVPTTTTIKEEVTESTEIAISTTTIETPTTSTTAPESITVSDYPESWAQALVDAANQDNFGLLDSYAFVSDQKRELFRVFVESDLPELELGSCEQNEFYSGCSFGSADKQMYRVELDLDSGSELFEDLLIRAQGIDDLASDGAYGSGCSPGPGPLTDGIWFGYIAARRSDAIDFDLACLLPNDWVDVEMVNSSAALRTLPVEGDLLVTQMIVSEFESESFAGTLYRDWGAEWCSVTGTCAVWIRIEGGRVIYIAEEFYA